MDVSPLLDPLWEIQTALAAVAMEQQQLRAEMMLHDRQPPAAVNRESVPHQSAAQATNRQHIGRQPQGATCYLCSGKHMAYHCPKAEEF